MKARPFEYCVYGWNDQNPYSHTTNMHLAKATKTVWLRLNQAIVLMLPVCDDHYEEVRKFTDKLYKRDYGK